MYRWQLAKITKEQHPPKTSAATVQTPFFRHFIDLVGDESPLVPPMINDATPESDHRSELTNQPLYLLRVDQRNG